MEMRLDCKSLTTDRQVLTNALSYDVSHLLTSHSKYVSKCCISTQNVSKYGWNVMIRC